MHPSIIEDHPLVATGMGTALAALPAAVHDIATGVAMLSGFIGLCTVVLTFRIQRLKLAQLQRDAAAQGKHREEE